MMNVTVIMMTMTMMGGLFELVLLGSIWVAVV